MGLITLLLKVLSVDDVYYHMPEKKPEQEKEEKIDWHRFEYSEVGNETVDEEGNPEQRENDKSLKKLEMFLRKSWCCGK